MHSVKALCFQRSYLAHYKQFRLFSKTICNVENACPNGHCKIILSHFNRAIALKCGIIKPTDDHLVLEGKEFNRLIRDANDQVCLCCWFFIRKILIPRKIYFSCLSKNPHSQIYRIMSVLGVTTKIRLGVATPSGSCSFPTNRQVQPCQRHHQQQADRQSRGRRSHWRRNQ